MGETTRTEMQDKLVAHLGARTACVRHRSGMWYATLRPLALAPGRAQAPAWVGKGGTVEAAILDALSKDGEA